jgi:hypothetical protein
VIVISRTVQAVNYRHRSGATDVDLCRHGFAAFSRRQSQGAQQARHHGSRSRISETCKAPTTFGGEYLTYVLWAISPEGRQ